MFFLGHINITEEKKDERGVQRQADGKGPRRCGTHEDIEENGDKDIDGNTLHRIGNGIFPLPHKVREQHGGAVTRYPAPRTGHVAVLGNEEVIDKQQHGTTYQGEPCSVNRSVNQFVPERQVEIDAHHDFGRHDNGHHHDALAIALADDELQYVDIPHHAEESQQGKDDKILHGKGVVLVLVAIFGFGKNDGLVGVAESLRYHGHNHGYLRATAVDAQLHIGLGLVGIDKREYDFVGHLIQNSRNAQYQYGPRVGKHPPQKCPVEIPVNPNQVGDEEQGDKPGAGQIDGKDVEDTRLAEHDEVKQIEPDIEGYKQEFERGETDGTLLEPQIAERQGLQGIHGHNDRHYPEVFGMPGIPKGGGYGGNETKDEQQEQSRERAYQGKTGRENRPLPDFGILYSPHREGGIIGIAEERGLEAEGEQHHNERGIGVNVGRYAVIARLGGHIVSVEGNEQVVEETPHDAAQPIDNSVLKEPFVFFRNSYFYTHCFRDYFGSLYKMYRDFTFHSIEEQISHDNGRNNARKVGEQTGRHGMARVAHTD